MIPRHSLFFTLFVVTMGISGVGCPNTDLPPTINLNNVPGWFRSDITEARVGVSFSESVQGVALDSSITISGGTAVIEDLVGSGKGPYLFWIRGLEPGGTYVLSATQAITDSAGNALTPIDHDIQVHQTGSTWTTDIFPLVQNHCLSCHDGSDNDIPDFSTYDLIMTADVIVPGFPDSSLLSTNVKNRLMPPSSEPPLTEEQITLIASWISEGAVE